MSTAVPLDYEQRWAALEKWDQRITERLAAYQAAEPHLRADTVAGMSAFLRAVPEGMPFPYLGLGDDGSLDAEWDVGPLHLLVGFSGGGVTDDGGAACG